MWFSSKPVPMIFDHLTIDQVADEARKASNEVASFYARTRADAAGPLEGTATFWLAVLQARAMQEAAEVQRRTNRLLVGATVVLAVATIALVIVTLFVRPEIVVEVPGP